MSRLPEKLVLMMAILAAGCLAAGCGSGSVKNAVSSAAASKSISVSPPTISPRTSNPAPTTAPTTVPTTAAVTSQPAVTASAVAPAPAPSSQPPAASESPAASGSGSSLLWLWILLGVIAVVGVAVLIARRSGRRSAQAAGWRSKVVDVYAKGSALYDAMSVAEHLGAQPPEDDSIRWADIQRRTGDLAQELYALRETAPGEAERAQVANVLASLRALRSAMDAEHAPGGAGPSQGTGPSQGARVHGLLLSFEASLRALHSPGESGASI
jgi:hypothetical protein